VIGINKVAIIVLTITIFFTSLILPIRNASAFTIPEVSKATKIIRALGEKIGIKWTAPSLYAAVGYILADNTPEGLSFVGDIPIMDGQIKPDDYQEYLLDPIDWKNGIKLIDKASKALIPEAVVPIWGNCNSGFAHMQRSLTYIKQNQSTDGRITVTSNGFSALVPFPSLGANPTDTLEVTDIKWFKSSGIPISVNSTFYVKYYASGNSTPYAQGSSSGVIFQIPDVMTGFLSSPVNYDDGQCNKTVTSDDVTNITNINTTIINNIDNSTTYIMPIDVPVTDDPGDVTVPWNPPLTPEETDGIFAPPPPKDTDNDGLPDDTDITPGGEVPVPDDTGIFAKLFPILLIVKLFGVLGSCLMYLIRMFQFIMTIPGIEAIPIDNDAFVWFRSAQIVGIKIYDVVSSLAGVGLSFIVFRAIRRAYL
jgi:hypothetical protein